MEICVKNIQNLARFSLEKVFEYPIIDVLSKPFNEANVKRLVEKTINKEM
mgnify:CR=1 FL=1